MANAQLLEKLPPLPDAPREDDPDSVRNLGQHLLYTPDRKIPAILFEIHVEPAQGKNIKTVDAVLGMHVFGRELRDASNPLPYIGSYAESSTSSRPIHVAGLDVYRDITSRSPGHTTSCLRAILEEIPLGVACVLLTISSHAIPSLGNVKLVVRSCQLQKGKFLPMKTIAQRTLPRNEFLGSVSAQQGTVCLCSLSRYAAWWHIRPRTDVIRDVNTVEGFGQAMCLPQANGQRIIAGVVNPMEVFLPETRTIKLRLLSVDGVEVHGRTRIPGRARKPEYTLWALHPNSDEPRWMSTQGPESGGGASWTFPNIPVVFVSVTAADPRVLRVEFKREGVGSSDGGPDKNDLLGAANVQLARMWNVLHESEDSVERKLKVRLTEGASLGMLVKMWLCVTRERFDPGVQYRA